MSTKNKPVLEWHREAASKIDSLAITVDMAAQIIANCEPQVDTSLADAEQRRLDQEETTSETNRSNQHK